MSVRFLRFDSVRRDIIKNNRKNENKTKPKILPPLRCTFFVSWFLFFVCANVICGATSANFHTPTQGQTGTQIGPKLGPCCPKLIPSGADVAAMLDRNGSCGRFGANYKSGEPTFAALFRANVPFPPLTLYLHAYTSTYFHAEIPTKLQAYKVIYLRIDVPTHSHAYKITYRRYALSPGLSVATWWFVSKSTWAGQLHGQFFENGGLANCLAKPVGGCFVASLGTWEGLSGNLG